MTPRRFALLACVLAAVVVAGCGGDSADGGEGRAAESQAAVERGWASYSQRDFSVALVEFERAANLDDTRADAHNGVGWTRLHLLQGAPSADVLRLAAASFAAALQADSDFADAWVGMGQALYMTRADVKSLLDAANALSSARAAASASLYRHDYTSEAQIRALEAWCYYYAGDTVAASAAALAATQLDPTVVAATVLTQLTR